MRNLALLGIIGLLFFLTAAVSFAESASDETADESAAGSEMRFDEEDAAVETGGDMSGKVVSVNANTDSLVVKDEEYGGKIYRFTMTDETTFTECDSLRDIESGDTVTVDYYSLDDSRIAEGIILDKKGYQEEEPMPELEKPLVD